MKRYPEVKDGEWVYPVRHGYKMKCCDCGLVHVLNFKLVKRGRGHIILISGHRDERSTAAGRREKKKKEARAIKRMEKEREK